MKRVLVATLPDAAVPAILDPEEAHHLVQVLRARNGEKIEVLDGKGAKIAAEIELLGKGKAKLHARGEALRDVRLNSLPIVLEMAILKGEAMEWTVEKACELGVRHFVPVVCAHAVVQVDRKGPQFYQERWQKIADQSLKQSGRLERMIVEEPISLESLVAKPRGLRLWADETTRADSPHIFEALASASTETRLAGVSILVGPEGGWSDAERALLSRSECRSTTLGPWVLRAETAALFATSLVVASMR